MKGTIMKGTIMKGDNHERDNHERDNHERDNHERDNHERDNHERDNHERDNHERDNHERDNHERDNHERDNHERDNHERDNHERDNHERDRNVKKKKKGTGTWRKKGQEKEKGQRTKSQRPPGHPARVHTRPCPGGLPKEGTRWISWQADGASWSLQIRGAKPRPRTSLGDGTYPEHPERTGMNTTARRARPPMRCPRLSNTLPIDMLWSTRSSCPRSRTPCLVPANAHCDLHGAGHARHAKLSYKADFHAKTRGCHPWVWVWGEEPPKHNPPKKEKDKKKTKNEKNRRRGWRRPFVQKGSFSVFSNSSFTPKLYS